LKAEFVALSLISAKRHIFHYAYQIYQTELVDNTNIFWKFEKVKIKITKSSHSYLKLVCCAAGTGK